MYYAGRDLGRNEEEKEKKDWCFCNVCKLSFKNQQHYTIHCNGLLHSERLAALYSKAEQNVAGAVSSQISDTQKVPKVDGYTSYQEPSSGSTRSFNSGAMVSADRESYSTYDTAYMSSYQDVDQQRTSSDSGRGRGRGSSAVGTTGIGGWGSSVSGRSQSLTRPSSDYSDVGYGVESSSDSSRYASVTGLSSEKRSFSLAGGLDSGYSSAVDKSSLTETYGYASHGSSSGLYGATSDYMSENWSYVTDPGLNCDARGYGSAPVLTSDTFSYESNAGSADNQNWNVSTGVASSSSGYKSASQFSSDKQNYSLKAASYGASSSKSAGSSTWTHAPGSSTSNVTAKTYDYANSAQIPSSSHDYSSVKDASAQKWKYGTSSEQLSEIYIYGGYAAGLSGDYGYGSLGTDTASSWNQAQKMDPVEATDCKTDYGAAPQVFDYGHKDCTPESADVWEGSSSYYGSAYDKSSSWSKESDQKQTTGYKSSGSAAYSTELGSSRSYSYGSSQQLTSAERATRGGMRGDDYGQYNRKSQEVKQSEQDRLKKYADDAYSNKVNSQSSSRFTPSSSSNAASSRYHSTDSRSEDSARWKASSESSSDAAYWTSADASYSTKTSNKSSESLDVPRTTAGNVKLFMDSYTENRRGSEPSYTSSSTRRFTENKPEDRSRVQKEPVHETIGKPSGMLNVPRTMAGNVKSLMDISFNSRRDPDSFRSVEIGRTQQTAVSSVSSSFQATSLASSNHRFQGTVTTVSSQKSSVVSSLGGSLAKPSVQTSSTSRETIVSHPSSAYANQSRASTISVASTSSVISSTTGYSSVNSGFRTSSHMSFGRASSVSQSSSSNAGFSTSSPVLKSSSSPQTPPSSLGFRTPSLVHTSRLTSSVPSVVVNSTTTAVASKSAGEVQTLNSSSVVTISSTRSQTSSSSSPLPPSSVSSSAGLVGVSVRAVSTSTSVGGEFKAPAAPVRQLSPATSRQPVPATLTSTPASMRSTVASCTVRAPITPSTSPFGSARQPNPVVTTSNAPSWKSPVSTCTVGAKTSVAVSSPIGGSPGAVSAGSSATARPPSPATSPLLRTPGSASSLRTSNAGVASGAKTPSSSPTFVSSGSAVTTPKSPLIKSPVAVVTPVVCNASVPGSLSSTRAAVPVSGSSVTQPSTGIRQSVVPSTLPAWRTPKPVGVTKSSQLTSESSVSSSLVRPIVVTAVATSSSAVSSSNKLNSTESTTVASMSASVISSLGTVASAVNSLRTSGLFSTASDRVQVKTATTASSAPLSVPTCTPPSTVRAPGSISIRTPRVQSSASVRSSTPGSTPATVSQTAGASVASIASSVTTSSGNVSAHKLNSTSVTSSVGVITDSTIKPCSVTSSPLLRTPFSTLSTGLSTSSPSVRASLRAPVSSATSGTPTVVSGTSVGKPVVAVGTSCSSVAKSPVTSGQSLRNPGMSSTMPSVRASFVASSSAVRTPGVSSASSSSVSIRSLGPASATTMSPTAKSTGAVSTAAAGVTSVAVVSSAAISSPGTVLATTVSATGSAPRPVSSGFTRLSTPVLSSTSPFLKAPRLPSSAAVGTSTPTASSVSSSSISSAGVGTPSSGLRSSALPAWRTPRPVGIAKSTVSTPTTVGAVVSSSTVTTPVSSTESTACKVIGLEAKPATSVSVIVDAKSQPLSNAASESNPSSMTSVEQVNDAKCALAVQSSNTVTAVAGVASSSSGSTGQSFTAAASKSGSPALTSSSGSQTSTASKTNEVQKQPGSTVLAQQKDARKEDSADQNVKTTVETKGVIEQSEQTSKTEKSEPSSVTKGSSAAATKTSIAAVSSKAADSKDASLLSRLSAMEPKDLLKEIVSGRVPVSILDRVTDRLPAEMLQEAVDYLTKTSSSSGEKAASAADSSNGNKLSTGSKAGPGDSDKPGSLKRKLEEVDVSKLKNMEFDDMLALFQQTLQDVLGGMFKTDAKSAMANANAAALKDLSAEDRSLVLEMQKSYGVGDIAKVVDALRLLRSLDPSVVEALGQLDLEIVRKSMAGNTQAEQVGGTALRRLASFVTGAKKPLLTSSSSETSTSVAAGQSQSAPAKRPATTVPSLFSASTSNKSQPLPEKKQRIDVRPRSGVAGPRPPARAILPTPRMRPTIDSPWRARAAFGVPSNPRFRPAGPRGFGRGYTGY